MTAKPLRALVCGPQGADRDAIETLLVESEHFEVAGRTTSSSEVAALCQQEHPDVLIIDEASVSEDLRELPKTLALERPLPTLLLIEAADAETQQERELSRRLQVYKLVKGSLRESGNVGKSYARTRLHLLATRAKEAKRAMPKGGLDAMRGGLRDEAAQASVSEAASTLTQTPLDVIVIALEDAAILRPALERLAAVRVPVLIAALSDTPVPTGQPVQTLTQPVPLRRAVGILTAPRDRRVVLTDEIIMVGPRIGTGLKLEELVRSLVALGPSALAVGVAPVLPPVAAALTVVEGAGCATAVFAPVANLTRADNPRAPATLSPTDLSYVLGNATPHRI